MGGNLCCVRRPYKHCPVQDSHVPPRNLNCFVNLSGAEGCNEGDVVVVGLVQLLNGVGMKQSYSSASGS